MATSLIFLTLLVTIIIHATTTHALNILVVGGSGRVGGSTVRWLETLSSRQNTLPHSPSSASTVSLTVGGRKIESFEAAQRNKVIPSKNVDFLSLDIDGDESILKQTLHRWKQRANENPCLVIHTAGPFQGRRSPILLATCIDLGIPYVDVCDEWDLAKLSKETLHSIAMENHVPAILSCGIWPGVSALMAARGVEFFTLQQNQDWEISSIDYSFFTAGTGNAGPTIVSATFLLLATPAITFCSGKRIEKEPWTEMKTIDFGRGVGSKPIWLLDNPDVPTTALYLNRPSTNSNDESPRTNRWNMNVSSRFGTDPLIWNYLFGAMKSLPKSLLYNRDAMQNFSLFSEPIIRLVDKLVGATNAMRVDVTAKDVKTGEEKVITLRMAHDDLEQCVGLATAAFALEVAKSMGKGGTDGREETGATVSPGVWFPVELGKDARENILEIVKEGAFVYELDR
ncbi:hypothetical protein HJC23_013638 [Cyclotella cryptica]|uniref:Saccharopine dehydrogenase NADP binding domain-containing protein n=1 Tax=Cyclotella cryptica TaxID=29204 RepID=A0ABD3P8I5_9STRA